LLKEALTIHQNVHFVIKLKKRAKKIEETIDHLLVSCVFTRQFWFIILQQFGLQAAAPQLADICFVDWWGGVSNMLSGHGKKEVNSIIILGAWLI